MKKELSLNPEMQEITDNDLREINGGYGYWEGHSQGSAAAGSLFWSATAEFLATALTSMASYPRL
ncbi:hypothetical protein [Larkinella rosea]|uniref:Bacteriocin n=1 Tax=Larkinella rosea TaxID=2025312 RepID=A0A3P1BU27_9BACT|nr:hypothetical protein [Larkinella rosea]RRB04557.1 hypothetical protein EHT25_13765 [Larkinella rosea]